MGEVPNDAGAGSVLDEIRNRVQSRLAELEPVALELNRLRTLLDVLESLEASGTDAPTVELSRLLGYAAAGGDAVGSLPRPVVRPGRRGTKRGSDGRAPQGANKQRITQTVLERPGVAAPEIAAVTGIKRTIVAATITRMKRAGELEPFADGVRVPLASPQSAAA